MTTDYLAHRFRFEPLLRIEAGRVTVVGHRARCRFCGTEEDDSARARVRFWAYKHTCPKEQPVSETVDDRIEPSRAEPWRPQYVGARWVATVDSVGKQHWEVACDCSLCGATVMAPQQGVHTDFHERLYRSACRG